MEVFMNNVKKLIKEFNEERDWDQFHSPENLAKSISIEAGELLECFQWNNNYDLEEVKEELADVLNYCIQMANKLGVDPKQIVMDKMEKTAKKYPVEKTKGKSDKYTKL
jgi:NTP pyrophosphatase (non-canonical NTP hydrolase)